MFCFSSDKTCFFHSDLCCVLCVFSPESLYFLPQSLYLHLKFCNFTSIFVISPQSLYFHLNLYIFTSIFIFSTSIFVASFEMSLVSPSTTIHMQQPSGLLAVLGFQLGCQETFSGFLVDIKLSLFWLIFN